MNLRFEMRNCFFLYFLLISCVLVPKASHSEVNFALYPPFEYPRCHSVYEDGGVLSQGGQTLYRPAGEFYCIEDLDNREPLQSEVLSSLTLQLDSIGQISEVTLSAAYFDGKVNAKWLCSLDLKPGASLSIYYPHQSELNTSRTRRVTSDFSEIASECFSKVEMISVGCDVFNPNPQDQNCDRSKINVHHAKILKFVGSRGVLYSLGSGNFTEGSLFRNIENWVTFRTKVPYGPVECIIDAVAQIARYPDNSSDWHRKQYESCKDMNLEIREINIFLFPFENYQYKDRVEDLFELSDRIVLYAQFLESEWLIELLERTTAEIILILDDAYYYTSMEDGGISFGFIDPENARYIVDMEDRFDNISIRYLQTNHNYALHLQANSVHARSVRFELADQTVVSIGSAHFKDVSFFNIEQVALLEGFAANVYNNYFDDLISRSVKRSDLPRLNTPAFAE